MKGHQSQMSVNMQGPVRETVHGRIPHHQRDVCFRVQSMVAWVGEVEEKSTSMCPTNSKITADFCCTFPSFVTYKNRVYLQCELGASSETLVVSPMSAPSSKLSFLEMELHERGENRLHGRVAALLENGFWAQRTRTNLLQNPSGKGGEPLPIGGNPYPFDWRIHVLACGAYVPPSARARPCIFPLLT